MAESFDPKTAAAARAEAPLESGARVSTEVIEVDEAAIGDVEIGDVDTWGPLGSTLAEPGGPRSRSESRFAQRQLSFEERYEVLEVVSETRLAEVRRCRDRPFARDVAMKVLRRNVAHPSSRWRFFREARVQGQLRHRAIVPVHDLGLDPHSDPFFTMAWVSGQTLGEAMERGVSRDVLLGGLVETCGAVAHAHRRGVVHRDLKPSNVRLGDAGDVYVLDWGLAKVRADGLSAGDPIVDASGAVETREGSVLGTIGYMAPEQLRGETMVDARSDTYSLGAMLFEILTGETLHRGSKTQRALSALQSDGGSPRARRPDLPIPELLDEICLAATRLDPADRTPSASDIANAILRSR